MPVAHVLSEREEVSRRKRRVLARRSFVAVLSGLVGFLAFQVGLAAAIDICAPEARDLSYMRRLYLVRESVRAEPVKPYTVLMLGSSHVQWGFQVRNGEEKAWSKAAGRPVAAFNFGAAGGGCLTELLNETKLRRDGVRPTLLLVEVLPALLSDRLPFVDYTESYLPTCRLRWEDLPLVERYAGKARASLRRDWLESWPLPLYADRFVLINRVEPLLLPSAQRLRGGDEILYGPPRTPFTFEQRRRATQFAKDDYCHRFALFHLGGLQCQALRELLASCREEGTPVALVVMPEGPTCRSWYTPGTWETIKGWLTQVSSEYDSPLIVAREWINDEDEFLDSHHLLPSGADKFTERLGREYILPMLRRQSGEEKASGELAARSSQS